jgi:hypothetical protein
VENAPRVIVFAGPSLRAADRIAGSLIDYRGPAACGDIARAAKDGASVIGLIDGAFESTRSPWHKEILWAMSRGVRVYGAASMGALRAAELYPYGMIGIGAVFLALRDGVIADDDEVAVLHGPRELGYVPITEAMVNVRWTIAAAEAAGIIAAAEAEVIVGRAKKIFYKDRTWPAIWQAVRETGLDTRLLIAAEAWAQRHSVNIKQQDARALIEVLPTANRSEREPQSLDFVDTIYWATVRTAMELD